MLDKTEDIRDTYHAMRRKRKTIAETIKQAIADSGLTYTELQRATGVKRASILRFMRGDQTLRLDIADRLAEHLGIEVELKQRK